MTLRTPINEVFDTNANHTASLADLSEHQRVLKAAGELAEMNDEQREQALAEGWANAAKTAKSRGFASPFWG